MSAPIAGPPVAEVPMIEACRQLRLQYHQAYQLLCLGRLEGVRRGRLWFITRASLDQELARMRAHNATPAR